MMYIVGLKLHNHIIFILKYILLISSEREVEILSILDAFLQPGMILWLNPNNFHSLHDCATRIAPLSTPTSTLSHFSLVRVEHRAGYTSKAPSLINQSLTLGVTTSSQTEAELQAPTPK